MPVKERAIAFSCHGDDLLGVLHQPPESGREVGILVVVGGPQYRVGSHRQFVLMARAWAAAGYPVLRFDYRGMGDSSGRARTFEDVDDDIRAAVDAFVAAIPCLRGVVIFGLCDAASAALMYCGSDERICGLILANPWVRTPQGEAESYLRHYYGSRLLQRSFWIKVLRGEFRLFKSAQDFLISWASARRRGDGGRVVGVGGFIDRMREGLEAFVGPVLVFISDHDLTAREFSDLCRAEPAWRRATTRECVETALLANADHTFSSRDALERAANVSLRWLSGVSSPTPADLQGTRSW